MLSSGIKRNEYLSWVSTFWKLAFLKVVLQCTHCTAIFKFRRRYKLPEKNKHLVCYCFFVKASKSKYSHFALWMHESTEVKRPAKTIIKFELFSMPKTNTLLILSIFQKLCYLQLLQRQKWTSKFLILSLHWYEGQFM